MTLIGKEIGELLVDNGLLTPEDLGVVEQEKLKTGESISKILARLGFASENQLKDTLELQYGVTFVSLAKLTPDPELVKRVPEELIRQLQVVPVSLTGSRLLLAMVNPDDSSALNEIRNYIQSDTVKAVVCIHDDFDTCLDGLFGEKADVSHGTNGGDPAAEFREDVDAELEPDLSFIDDATPLNIGTIGTNTGESALVDSTETIDASAVISQVEVNESGEMVSELPPPDLGELLLAKGIIDDDQLYDALKIGLKTKQSLAEVLVSMDLVTEEDLQLLLAEYFGSAIVESFDEEESAEYILEEEQYAQPIIKEEATEADLNEDLLSEELPETLEDVLAEEQLGVTDELISEEELEFSEDMLSEEQLKLLDQVFAKEEPGIVPETMVEDESAIVDEVVADEQPFILDEVVAEEEPEIVNEIVAEEQPAIVDQAVAEEQPAMVDQAVAEEQPEIVDEAVAEEEPEIVDEAVAEEHPAVVDEVVAEQELEIVDEVVAEEQPAVVDEAVAEEQPAVVDEAVAEEGPEIVDEAVAEEQPAVIDEAVAEEEPEIVNEVVAEEAPQVVDEAVAEEAPQVVDEVAAEEQQPAKVDEPVAEAEPETVNEAVAEEKAKVVEESVPEAKPEIVEDVIAQEQPEPAVPDAPETVDSAPLTVADEIVVAEPEQESAPVKEPIPAEEPPPAKEPSAQKSEDKPAAQIPTPVVEPKKSLQSGPVSNPEPPVVPDKVEDAPKKLKGISVSNQKREIFRVDDIEDDELDEDLLASDTKSAKVILPSRPSLGLRPVMSEAKQPDMSEILQRVEAAKDSKTEAATASDIDELDDDIDFLDLVKQAQYASISLLANHITSSAIELKCSDILFQGVGEDVVVQYLKKGRVVSESKLVKQIHPDLVACYKEMAGLDKAITNKPQDRKVKLNIRDTDIELRVTTVPEDEGEIVQISIKYI